jgi:SAM-dependent methyltransferase
MKMLRLEKLLVNSRWSKKRVTRLAQELLAFVDLEGETEYLEVGCGSGEVVKYIAQNYRGSVVGIDIDPEQIEIARKNAGDTANVRFLEIDSTDLPFKDGSFGVVVSFGVLHHIYNWLDALKEIKRVLKTGGYFVYADLIYPERITEMDRLSKLSFGLATIDIDEVNSFLEKNGFTTIHSKLTNKLVYQDYEAVYRKS